MAKKQRDYSKDIINLVQDEKQNYEDASQEIRTKIKRARANYMASFSQPTTSTGRKKKFLPLTRWEVDTFASKIFVNERALTVLPSDEKGVVPAMIADQTLKYQIKNSNFASKMRSSVFDLAIDGTFVYASFWDFFRETEEVVIPEGKKSLSKRVKDLFKKKKGKTTKQTAKVLKDNIGYAQIDLLNCFIDPTADSIQEAPSFIVKNIYHIDQVLSNPNFMNKELVKGVLEKKQDTWDATSTMQHDIGKETVDYVQPMVNVYQRWGDFPLSFITKNAKDDNTMVRNGVIEVADLYDGAPVILRVARNPFDHHKKPFEECWFQKIKGRWYGIGIAEKDIDLQSAANKVWNRKEENEDMLHSSMFVVKRGSQIKASNIKARPGGVIYADDPKNDIQQLQIRDVSQLGNGSLQFIFDMVERINGVNAIATGSAADRSATTSIIKDRNADTRFALVRGNINDFLIRFFTQWIQLDRQFLTSEFVLRVTGDDIDFKMLDRATGFDQQPIEDELKPGFRFIEVDPDDIRQNFDLDVDIDLSQPQNKAENAQRILQGIQLGAQLNLQRDYEKLFDAYLDNIGLTGLRFKSRKPQPQEPQEPQESIQAPTTQVDELLQANQVPEQPGVPSAQSIASQLNV